ncbi:hypothetical protein [Rhodocista pekingensis]|uniref:PIN domain-containing protein n=1 Tax=Rhodocista pekingensis TaxID=201185 RepID=A0ABW2KVL8_9PROT
MVVFDTTTLLVLIAPPDLVRVMAPGNRPVPDARERLDYLVARLQTDKTKISIPTPALSEALVRAGRAGLAYVEKLSKSAAFSIDSFDILAAQEAAIMCSEARAAGDKRGGAQGDWQKVKVDRQIVAIAKVRRAATIYSNDADIRAMAPSAGLSVVGLEELPLPPTPPKRDMPLLDYMTDANG